MTPQQGPYPTYPQPGEPLWPQQAKPPTPATVQWAFYLMLAGAVLALAQIIAVEAAVRDAENDIRGVFDAMSADGVITGFIVTSVVIGLVLAALWIWMAFMNSAGRQWARITATVFFGLAVAAAPTANFYGAAGSAEGVETSFRITLFSTPFTAAIEILSLLTGLAVIILLWNGRSTPHFQPPTAYFPPGHHQAPPGPPTPPFTSPAEPPGPAPHPTPPTDFTPPQ